MSEIAPLPITHPTGSYNVYVGYGLLAQLADLAPIQGDVALITDAQVAPLYAAQVTATLPQRVVPVTVPAGEAHKTLDTVRTIYEQLLIAQLGRQTTVVALGGGVINDMAGFVAATFLRGVRFVTCPTSLLAMVDASVGGKTGVDMPQGKNLVGAFKQPAAVLADLETLATLPTAEFSAGMAEIIKHGLINDPDLFEQLTTRQWETSHDLRDLIITAIRVKRDVVQEDPFESGRRALLNLGHTFGHAIEQVSHYAIGHGQAVAMGLVCAAHLSATLGYCSPTLQQTIEQALQLAQLPTRLPARLNPQSLLEAMQTDKKKVRGQLRFVLLHSIGDCFIAGDVPPTAVLETMQALMI